MEHQGIRYKFNIKQDINLSDNITIELINLNNQEIIGYLTYTENNYFSDEWESLEPKEICEIVEDYEPISLDYIHVYQKYMCKGFGTILMKYFVENIVKNNVCILLKCAYDIPIDLKQYFNDIILKKFYEKFGFKIIENTEYMVANLY